MTAEALIKSLQQKKYAPIYLLHGEEAYFIDAIANYIEKNVLSEEEQAFNQSVLYGLDTQAEDLILAAKRYPMMAERQVIVLREAQMMRDFDKLEAYIENPQPSTLLVICYKGKTIDKRKKVGIALQKKAVVFESKSLKENELPDWIARQVKRRKLNITPRAVLMLGEFVGNDLEKIANEIDKLAINLTEGGQITEQMVEDQVGVSKEYNNFELQNALGKRNIMKAYSIAQWLGRNEKSAPLVLIISSLFAYFSKLLHLHYCQRKKIDPKTIGLHPYILREYEAAARNYTTVKLIQIIGFLREADLKSKGYGAQNLSAEDLLKELVFKIIH